MPEIGQNLSHYSITEKIGKGGMGEVFRAKDQKLGRDVAIKVLPEEFARDADRVARFQREAKLLASLNHPNIAAIYGLEESGGTNFLVLELVEGDTLADRIKAGPIPVEESLKLGLQIAEALEAAHEKGVIHRDLKPANIKVTPEGKVKVLDFGLAKAFAGEQAELNLSNSPTLSDMATMQGVILGTAAYMSPEQARGKAVDKRTDIWALGCVLYEMLTGQAAFQGDDVTEILASVVKAGVDLDLLPANIHPRVREVIIRCLQKDLKKRYPDIADVRYEIEQALADPGGVLVQPLAAAERPRSLRTILSWVAAVVILSTITGAVVWRLRTPEPRQVIRFDYELPEGQQFSDLTYAALAVSPDGKQFVYSTTKALYSRSVEELTAKIIPGTEENPQQPFFSPDGKWIGYVSVADRKLKKIAINGGVPVVLCDFNIVLLNASWGADNKIVYSDSGKGIMRISENGGTPELLVRQTGSSLVNPQILPDGKTALFGMVYDLNRNSFPIAVQSLKSDEPKTLIEGGYGRYLPTGHLVYAVRNSLFAAPFDLGRLEIKGDSVSSLIEAVYRLGNSTPQYAVSDSGTLVYIHGITGAAASVQRTLVWVDRKGKEVPIAVAPNEYGIPRVSPDGTKVALTVFSGSKSDVWTLDLVSRNMSRLTFNDESRWPLWSRDGKRIAFVSYANKPKLELYWKAADGTGKDELLLSLPSTTIYPWSWSGDGKTLVIMVNRGEGLDIGELSMEGDHKVRMLLTEKYHETQAKISPDGKWMAYVSNESGKLEVYVRPFPEVDKGKWQVSTSGGAGPLWSRDGRELFYFSGDTFIAVPVKTEPAFSFETAKILFQGKYSNDGPMKAWDVSPDGKRFLMIKDVTPTGKPAALEAPRKINVVVNWFEELKQRVPTK